MSMTEERCIFPHSDNSIFTPLQDFPWYEERYGSKTLPWKKWIMAENLPDDTEETKIVRATFRAVVRKMIVGRQLRSGIAGSLKGKLLMRADLPGALEQEVAKQLDCILPAKPRKLSFRRKSLKKTDVMSKTIEECNEDSDEDLDPFDEDGFDDLDPEDLEWAFEHFLHKLDNLDPEDFSDIKSGLKTGLQSWLQFGASMASQAKGTTSMGRDKALSTTVEPTRNPKIKTLYRGSTQEGSFVMEDVLEDLGGKPPKSHKRAAKALAQINKGDDKLTRRAEEKVSKITGDFCAWLKDLPQGEDQTVNNISPEKIRNLFDSTNVSKSGSSKVVEGLRSWAKFGMDISGAANSSILSLAKTEMSKMRAKKKFEKYGKEKEKKKIKKSAKNDLPAKFDHRNYGAWYINSAKWESRFHSLSDQKSVKILKNRRIPENERQLNAQTGESKSQFPQEDTKELHSVKAFAEFIKQRKAYEPPPFLRRAIGWQDETDED